MRKILSEITKMIEKETYRLYDCNLDYVGFELSINDKIIEVYVSERNSYVNVYDIEKGTELDNVSDYLSAKLPDWYDLSPENYKSALCAYAADQRFQCYRENHYSH